ncbi:MAG TPA: glutamate formimidoyltransferase [bacterium]|nr:glutamate formimidoyltransferase [bacterium]HPN34467.1 glutamate formimidoyltransferase [bacterium]
MQKIVECVPNFSEGRDQTKIEQIAAAIRSVDGVQLLDIDPGKDTNRTVMTLVGDPQGIMEAAFQAIAKAAELIDMSTHRGAHPRLGATDVCPFIPVSGITMDECSELARRLGKRVGEELDIPVYLYEKAAVRPERSNLADIRSGEYEGLAQKLRHPEWQPDFGPARFNPKSGAVVIGSREFLIAYNVNLNTRDMRIANEIAGLIRESGRPQKDDEGRILRDADGEALRIPGIFKACKAVGWYLEQFGRAQISINLTDYHQTPPHLVFDACCRLAEERGVRVTGSELVGLIPLQAMLEAGRYYLHKQKKSAGVTEAELVHMAVLSLGLADLGPFDPAQKIIDYRLSGKGPLISMKLDGFIDLLSSEAPAPGGGSVAALCGALSCALSSMVAALTYGKKGYESVYVEMDAVGVQAQRLKDEFSQDIDRDTEAFNQVMAAWRLPKKTVEEITARKQAIEEATRMATLVPLTVLQRCRQAVDLAAAVAKSGNKNSLSDAAVAAATVRAAAEGAFVNVCINLPGIADEVFKNDIRQQAQKIKEETVALSQALLQEIEQQLEG